MTYPAKQKGVHDILHRAMNDTCWKDGLFMYYQHEATLTEPYAIAEVIAGFHAALTKDNPPAGSVTAPADGR